MKKGDLTLCVIDPGNPMHDPTRTGDPYPHRPQPAPASKRPNALSPTFIPPDPAIPKRTLAQRPTQPC
ncbi:hypothetical protein V6N12_062211 [Hibiscus sabdariffa]|uniref:Uncharacterized protein n=1 Tax=Hibiscus sabdariffa TaxID=183260 RepID=A0ABR2F862_9ROSI